MPEAVEKDREPLNNGREALKALAVIPDTQFYVLGFHLQLNPHLGGSCILGHVAQRFLDNAFSNKGGITVNQYCQPPFAFQVTKPVLFGSQPPHSHRINEFKMAGIKT